MGSRKAEIFVHDGHYGREKKAQR